MVFVLCCSDLFLCVFHCSSLEFCKQILNLFVVSVQFMISFYVSQLTLRNCIEECKFPPEPDAICRYQQCHGHSKIQIYFTDPDFKVNFWFKRVWEIKFHVYMFSPTFRLKGYLEHTILSYLLLSCAVFSSCLFYF